MRSILLRWSGLFARRVSIDIWVDLDPGRLDGLVNCVRVWGEGWAGSGTCTIVQV